MLSSFLVLSLGAAAIASAPPPDLVPQVDPVTGLGAFRGELSDCAPSPFVPIGTIGLERAPGLVPYEILERASALIVSWGEGPTEYLLEMPLSNDDGAALEVLAMIDAWSAQVEVHAAPLGADRFFISAAGASSDGLERLVMGFVNNERAGREQQIRFVPAPGGFGAALVALLTLRRRRV